MVKKTMVHVQCLSFVQNLAVNQMQYTTKDKSESQISHDML